MAGFIVVVKSLRDSKVGPSSISGMFMTMFNSAMDAHALLVVWHDGQE
jgi:hypothetical protein